MDEIQPALTPEEWERFFRESVERGVRAIDAVITSSDLEEDESGVVTTAPGVSRKIVAMSAVLQDWGFTWADVQRNRKAAARHRRLAKGCNRPEERARHDVAAAGYQSTADRIAALLPPEGLPQIWPPTTDADHPPLGSHLPPIGT